MLKFLRDLFIALLLIAIALPPVFLLFALLAPEPKTNPNSKWEVYP